MEKSIKLIAKQNISPHNVDKTNQFLKQFHSDDLKKAKELISKGTLPVFDKLGLEHEFKSFDSKVLKQKVGYRVVRPKDPSKVRGRVLYLHGLGSSSNYVVHRLAKWAESGLEAVCYCTVNHGSTYNFRKKKNVPRGYVESYEDLVNLAHEAYELFKTDTMYLGAESMGGMTALLLLMHHKNGQQIQKHLTGLLLEAPAFSLPEAPSPGTIARSAYEWITYFFPRIRPFSFDPKKGNTNFWMSKIYGKHPMNQCSAPFQTLLQVVSGAERVKELVANKTNLDCPMMLSHGCIDSIVDIKGSEQIYRHNKNRVNWFLKFGSINHALVTEKSFIDQHQEMEAFFNETMK